MKSKKLPAFQFYPGDWKKDIGVQSLDMQSRAIWFEMILLMHESEERGKLVLNGKPMTDEMIARAIGIDIISFKQTASKLVANGVANYYQNTWSCRRMIRDENTIQSRREAGHKGGSIRQANVKQIPPPSSSVSSSSSVVVVKEEKEKEQKEREEKATTTTTTTERVNSINLPTTTTTTTTTNGKDNSTNNIPPVKATTEETERLIAPTPVKNPPPSEPTENITPKLKFPPPPKMSNPDPKYIPELGSADALANKNYINNIAAMIGKKMDIDNY